MTAWLPSWCGQTFSSCFSAAKDNQIIIRNVNLFPVVLKVFSFLVLLFSLQNNAWANNISVSSAAIVEQDSSANTVKVEFDLSWANSWRDSTNYDAAWVFFKYSTDSGSTWNHATLKTAGTTPTNFSVGSGTGVEIVVPTDKKGCFIQRSSLGSGSLSTTDIQVVWDYGHDGVSDSAASNTSAQVRVFAVEMVYIPQEGFYAGDGSAGTNGEFEFGGSAASLPGAINSEAGLSFASSATQWYYNSDSGTDDASSGTAFEVDEAFPKGYQAFYMMKYEITEGQWVGFFNTLASAQKTTRDITSSSGKNSDSTVDRNTVAWTSGDATTSRTDRACGYLSWMDVAAYADWAGLRPMTELEFEKAARGPLYPVDGEYAWATTTLTVCSNLTGSSEDGTETCQSPSGAMANFSNTNMTGGDGPNRGPLRAGFFATSSTTTRDTAGAGYYGVMELTGNVWERVVTLGNAAGRGFAGTHGDGILTTTSSYEGNATNPDWPGIDATSAARGVTGAGGSGRRGGGWSETTTALAEVSNRNRAGTTDSTRVKDYGGRCMRAAS